MPVKSAFLIAALLGVFNSPQEVNAPQPRSELRCPLAAEAFRNGQFERAADLARKCIEGGIRDGDTHKLLAFSSYMLRREADYVANLEQAIALDPRDATLHYHLGRFLYEKKQYREALERFRRTIELDSDNFKGLYYSGLCKQGGGDEKGAAEDYRRAIEVIEKKKVAYGWPFAALGDLLMLQGQLDAGLSWSYRSTRNDPTLAYTHYVYASALMKKDPGFEVEQELQRAIRLDPGYTEAFYLLGRYYTKIGEKEKAKTAFARFDELRKKPEPSPFGIRR